MERLILEEKLLNFQSEFKENFLVGQNLSLRHSPDECSGLPESGFSCEGSKEPSRTKAPDWNSLSQCFYIIKLSSQLP
jgi:hypothetical protein